MATVDVLKEFEVYLLARITENNSRRILPTIEKLLSGAGVTHKNASEPFFKGRALTLEDDIECVRQAAAEWLPFQASDPRCLDHGHGWAVNHPLQWFFNFKFWKENGVDPPKRKRVKTKSSKEAVVALQTPIKKKKTIAAQKLPPQLLPPQLLPPPPLPPPQKLLAPPPLPTAIVVANDDNIASLWPPSREARLASYCGSMLELVNFAKRYGKKGGISTKQVRNWLLKNPEFVPSWLRGLDWEVDHILSDRLGGLPWPHNYFLLPKSMNQRFSSWATPEKRKFVGEEAWNGATSFARWARNKMRAVVDLSSFDPVGAQFVGRV